MNIEAGTDPDPGAPWEWHLDPLLRARGMALVTLLWLPGKKKQEKGQRYRVWPLPTIHMPSTCHLSEWSKCPAQDYCSIILMTQTIAKEKRIRQLHPAASDPDGGAGFGLRNWWSSSQRCLKMKNGWNMLKPLTILALLRWLNCFMISWMTGAPISSASFSHQSMQLWRASRQQGWF